MRSLLLTICLLMGLPLPVWAMEHHTDVLQDIKGNIIGQATVTVYLVDTTTKASLFSDNGITTKANPFQTNTFDGTFDFYSANGVYDIVFSKPGVTFNAALTKRIALFDLNDGGGGSSSAAFTAITSGTNVLAAMVCDTGCSLTFTGNGLLNASQFRGNNVVASLDGGTGIAVPTDDALLIGNGSIWQLKTIPPCNNPTTSKLLYDSSANALSCGVDQSAGGGVTFDTIGAGTNISAAMLLGSGSSLSVTGTGSSTGTNFWPNLVTVNAGNSPYTALTTNAMIFCDTTGGARVVNLPAATAKVILTFFNNGSNTCTINRAGADQIFTGISSGSSFVIRNSGTTFWLQPDGVVTWYVGG
jgi:hypothetical protein